VTIWVHSRKGRIEGELVRQSGEWMHVRLTGHQQPHYYSEANRHLVHLDGEIITLRASFMTELAAADQQEARD
jgi:hypothetical protein